MLGEGAVEEGGGPPRVPLARQGAPGPADPRLEIRALVRRDEAVVAGDENQQRRPHAGDRLEDVARRSVEADTARKAGELCRLAPRDRASVTEAEREDRAGATAAGGAQVGAGGGNIRVGAEAALRLAHEGVVGCEVEALVARAVARGAPVVVDRDGVEADLREALGKLLVEAPEPAHRRDDRDADPARAGRMGIAGQQRVPVARCEVEVAAANSLH